ncbi:MAG: YdeI/OmpD-associated family protein [Ilumatobacter sp.]|uniref:YdeI/OmpD-associated family protein n=1 Tax=Ilumatobacter sp. TaxID=1967498 RepID=UPI00329A5EE5
MWKFDYPIFHAENREQWRAWLAHHHESERGVWLCSWRSTTDRPRCPYPEAVEQAICFGWIDSTAAVLDDDRGLQLMTPRKAKSSWTRLNRQRAADMEAAGDMTDAGRRVIEIAKGNGWWTIFDPVEDLVEPDELAGALDARSDARANWDGFSPSSRKQMLWWVVSAIQPATKTDRIGQIVEAAADGRKAKG